MDPAIEALDRALREGSTADLIRAATAVLDRCGYHPSQRIECEETTQPVDITLFSPELRAMLLEELELIELGQPVATAAALPEADLDPENTADEVIL